MTGRAVVRLSSKVSEAPNGCLLFVGCKDQEGYGLFWFNGKMRRAHQVAWELANGVPFPSGLVSRHTCNNRACVNPLHIVPGTPGENRRDVVRSGNDPRANQTHCKRGHPLSGDNLLVKTRARGSYRSCRACQAEHALRSAERKQDA